MKFLSSSRCSDELWGPSSVIGVSFPGTKRPECETDNSPLSSAKIKNIWSSTSTPPYVFIACFVTEHRES
jgi:hypothetical protein